MSEDLLDVEIVIRAESSLADTVTLVTYLPSTRSTSPLLRRPGHLNIAVISTARFDLESREIAGRSPIPGRAIGRVVPMFAPTWRPSRSTGAARRSACLIDELIRCH